MRKEEKGKINRTGRRATVLKNGVNRRKIRKNEVEEEKENKNQKEETKEE